MAVSDLFSGDTRELSRDQVNFSGSIKLKTCVEMEVRIDVASNDPPEADGWDEQAAPPSTCLTDININYYFESQKFREYFLLYNKSSKFIEDEVKYQP